MVLDENFWDEKRQVHPNLDETAPNRWDTASVPHLGLSSMEGYARMNPQPVAE